MKKIKKIRCTIPTIMDEKLKEDMESFNISKMILGNRIITYYSDKELTNIQIKSDKGETFQFNSNENIDDDYINEIVKEHKTETISEYIRRAIFTYLENPRVKREKIIFQENIEKIEEALKKKKKINVKYQKERRVLNPYFIKATSSEDRSYLFSYCEKNNEFRNYRIANLKDIRLSKLDIEVKDQEYIEKIKEKFDPFLSYGHEVRIKMSPEAEWLYKRVLANRPKVLNKDGDIWIFQCTEKLAEIYFTQFLSKIEILEPIGLRKKFKANFEEMVKIYEKEQ